MKRQTLIKLIVLVVLIALIIWAGVNFRDQLSITNLRNTISGYGIWGPVIFIGIYIAATVLFLPGAALTISGGLIFGAAWGTLYNITGAVIGATIAFLIARYIASDWVAQKTGGKLKKLLDGVDKEGWKFVAVVRLVPLFPFNLLNYALGLTKIGVVAYILASAIFMLPGAFAYTYLGSLGEAFVHGNAREIVTKVLIAVGLLVLVACIPWVVKQVRGNKDLEEGSIEK